MKRRGIVFERRSRETAAGGAKRVYPCTEELRKVLGQGQTLVFHGKVYARSTNGRLSFSAYEASIPGIVPRDEGVALTLVGTYSGIITNGVFRFSLPATFMADVEIVAEVDASTGSSVETVDFELAVTIVES